MLGNEPAHALLDAGDQKHAGQEMQQSIPGTSTTQS